MPAQTFHNSAPQISLFPITPQQPADRLIKLRDVERVLVNFFHRDSRPSRNTVIGWIEEGTLLGTQLGRGHNYYVWESSLDSFIEKLRADAAMAMAA